jgi:ketosteroid isomerase-like protein
VGLLLILTLGGNAQTLKAASCTTPEYRQLDFWVGDWDVFEVDSGTKDAHVRVDRILGGCVLHEVYEDNAGLHGESFSIFDDSRRAWHQSWVTNRGQLLIIEGGLHGDAMVLEGSYKAADGVTTFVRGTWKPESGAVRETAVKSTDGGKTWKPWFDLMFRRRANASASDDANAVAELDTKYQLAVKQNDAATMDRILADDFILISSQGKTYTKAELLEEARSGRMRYEHQEDTDQKVRVWGDTAVVTAKLWEKGTENGKTFDYTLWFSDTYVRTPSGWRYVFGQASAPLTNATAQSK